MNIRHNKILDILRNKKFATVSDLSQLLYTSESTVRRDLTELQHDGLIVRTRGGAMFVEDTYLEWPMSFKSQKNTDKKQIIAEKAINLVKDNQTIFLDSSSTCTVFAKYLSEKKGLTVLTNGIINASILADGANTKVYCVCGEIYPKRYSITGEDACEYISQFYADISFVSCRGISPKIGVTDFSKGDSNVKKMFNKRSKMTILLADSSKFNVSFFHKTFDINDIDIIVTDSMPDKEFLQYIKQSGCKII